MTDIYLFEDYPLLGKFRFPRSYLELVSEELPEIDPWFWLAPFKDLSLFWANTLREQFPKRHLIPFAKDGGSDDVACFDGRDETGEPKVFLIHSFCDPGYEFRGETKDFATWLIQMEKLAAEFKADSQQCE